jgi:Secretion system C-terminal sorting domain/Concanavalin A-like lectin/glucanases superfamily
VFHYYRLKVTKRFDVQFRVSESMVWVSKQCWLTQNTVSLTGVLFIKWFIQLCIIKKYITIKTFIMKQKLLFYSIIICFAIITFCTVSAFSQIPTAGLMAYWNFDNNLIDTSASNHNLTSEAVGGLVNYVPGIKGKAAGSGGGFYSDDYFLPSASFSIGGWVKHHSLTSATSNPTILELQQSVLLRFNASFSSLEGCFAYNTSPLYACTSTGITSDTSWHHYMGVHDYAGQNAYLFVDGKLISTYYIGSSLPVVSFAAPHPCMVGYGPGGSAVNMQKYLMSDLDEVLIYQVALDTNQVKRIYCDGYLQTPVISFANNTVSIDGTTSDSIQWYLNGNAITGAQSNSYTASTSGSYTATVYSKFGCFKTSDAKSVTITSGNGINDLNSIQFSISPNPTNNLITINSAVLNTEINIFSIEGKNMLNDKIIGSQKRIDVSDFAKGIYIVELKADGKVSRTKMIKE